MQSQSVNPAFYQVPKEQMSSEEFQRMLYKWFEEKGLVSDLRSYLRVLMINSLRSTCVGRLERQKNSFSLQKQAFSLLIAEHLLREGCHYTLSIYTTEVPGVANQLPFSIVEAHKHDQTWRFDQEMALNVLELIGFSKDGTESLRILGLYFKNFGSLLSCLVSCKKVESLQAATVGDGDVFTFLKNIFSALGVPENIVEEVNTKIGKYIRDERQQNHIQVENHFSEIIEKLKEQLLDKDKATKVLLEQQTLLEKNYKKIKTDLKDTRKRLNQMIFQEKTMKMKENQLKEKLSELSDLGRRLKDGFSQDKGRTQESCSQKHCTTACESNLQLNNELKTELSKIQASDKEKTAEIERLQTKINCLIIDLQTSQVKMEFLNSCLVRSSQLNIQPGSRLHITTLHSNNHILGVETQDNTEDASDSITLDILQQVHGRLQHLEQENELLDQKLKQLKMK